MKCWSHDCSARPIRTCLFSPAMALRSGYTFNPTARNFFTFFVHRWTVSISGIAVPKHSFLIQNQFNKKYCILRGADLDCFDWIGYFVHLLFYPLGIYGWWKRPRWNPFLTLRQICSRVTYWAGCALNDIMRLIIFHHCYNSSSASRFIDL